MIDIALGLFAYDCFLIVMAGVVGVLWAIGIVIHAVNSTRGLK